MNQEEVDLQCKRLNEFRSCEEQIRDIERIIDCQNFKINEIYGTDEQNNRLMRINPLIAEDVMAFIVKKSKEILPVITRKRNEI